MHIIMNPPYNGNLHLKILREVIEQCNGAEIVNLSPIRWLQDPLAEYKKGSDYNKFEDVRKKIESLDVVSAKEAQEFFGIQHSDLGIYYLTKDASGFVRDTSLDSIFVKILAKAKEDSFRENITTDRTGLFIDVLDIYGGIIGKGSGFVKPLGYNRIPSSTACNGDKYWHCVKFDTKEEAENFYKTSLTKLYLFIFKFVRSGQRLLFEYVPFMPTYKHPWTDAELYDYFHLTEEERQEIEKCIL